MSKIRYIGQWVLFKGVKHAVQDTNFILQEAKIGIPDCNDMVWEQYWISWDVLEDVD